MSASLLQIDHLTKRYGGLVAVNDVSFDLREREILSVIGPNGAGKSTLFKLIASFVRPTAGKVTFNGEAISGRAPHIVARKGVVRTFQEATIFKGMTVRDNLIAAHHLMSRASLFGFYAGTSVARSDEAKFGASADYGICKAYAELGVTRLIIAAYEAPSTDLAQIERFVRKCRDDVMDRL